MIFETLDWTALATVLATALMAGFVTGFAGFGTALVAAGLWLHVLPAAVVPPLVCIASVAGQAIGLATVRRAFRWDRAWPFLAGALPGIPLGVLALERASPELLRAAVGGFLVVYAAAQLTGLARLRIGAWGGRPADGAVGFGGGLLGGFAGLSGPLPLIWLQLRGGTADEQRATYQPFNLLVLSTAAAAMALAGRVDGAVLTMVAVCLPGTLAGAWLGARSYRLVDEATFRLVVLGLLLVSGTVLIGRGLF